MNVTNFHYSNLIIEVVLGKALFTTILKVLRSQIRLYQRLNCDPDKARHFAPNRNHFCQVILPIDPAVGAS